jgi:general stress protein 26
MADLKLADIAEKMRDIDFAVLSTRTEGGAIAGRPMSNNREVEFDGDSWFFATEDTSMVDEIAADAAVGLTLQGKAGMLGLRPFFLAIDGKAELVRDRSLFEEHWTKDLERWWPDGLDTPGLLLIKVHADRVHYWDGEDEGEVKF